MIIIQQSHHVSKMYNRLATVLLRYESLWLSQWRTSIKDHDRTCLKSPMLLHKRGVDGTSAIQVNCHGQYVDADVLYSTKLGEVFNLAIWQIL